MSVPIIGWDIGGSNVKAARIQSATDGAPLMVEQPFALWREPQRLPDVLGEVAGRLGGANAMAVTMTAELADCFATKREGVGCVLDACAAAFAGSDTWVYGVDGRFRSVEAARRAPFVVAAANWMASATLVAETYPDAIFVDTGSTTTDVIPISDGRVVARGKTDPGRLRGGELVYTGALRTPICAIVRSLPLKGRRCRVAAEHFAIAADAHRWLGCITEDDYTCDTPDGRGRSRADAGARLARMVCADREMLDDDDITAIAEHTARAQVRQIASGLRQVMKRVGPALAVLAGQGRFLARSAAREAGLAVRDIADDFGSDAARHTAAAAVAYLVPRVLSINH